jgi:hypothetical protein
MSFIDDVIGGEVDSVVNAVKSVVNPRPASAARSGDAFTHNVIAAIPGAINRAKEQYDQVQAPQSTSLSTPFTVIKLDLRSDALYDGKGITQQVQGKSLLYRRQGSNYSGALKLTFPTGEVSIIRPGTSLKLRFDTMVVEALSAQFSSTSWPGDTQDVFANLLVFNDDTAALYEPDFEVPSEYGWRELIGANWGGGTAYLTRGLEEVVLYISFDTNQAAPSNFTITFSTARGDEQDLAPIPGFQTTIQGDGQWFFFVPVEVSSFQFLSFGITPDAGALDTLQVFAVK